MRKSMNDRGSPEEMREMITLSRTILTFDSIEFSAFNVSLTASITEIFSSGLLLHSIQGSILRKYAIRHFFR